MKLGFGIVDAWSWSEYVGVGVAHSAVDSLGLPFDAEAAFMKYLVSKINECFDVRYHSSLYQSGSSAAIAVVWPRVLSQLNELVCTPMELE